MKTGLFRGLLKALMVIIACMALYACSREDGSNPVSTVTVSTPDKFAQFVNKVAGLPAGSYKIVVGTSAAGIAGSFTVTVTFNDGTTQTFDGTWTSSFGTDITIGNNPDFDIEVMKAGGISITVDTTADACLYLLDRKNVLFSPVSIATCSKSIQIDDSRINNAAWGAAYYAAIDPINIKTTLQQWKDANGFTAASSAGRVINVRFRDTKDLGYGRGMRAWTDNNGDVFFFVENFQVRTVPGLEYSTLNLDALILNDRQHHFGSNAIEWSAYPYGPGDPCAFGSGAPCATNHPNPPKFAKFFTFDADEANDGHENEIRLDLVDLDGRGNKAMPGACIYCHGGTSRTLLPDGTFPDTIAALRNQGAPVQLIPGDTFAKLQLLELDTFEYWPNSPYTRADQEADLKLINSIIYCTYPNPAMAPVPQLCTDIGSIGSPAISGITPPDEIAGGWNGDFAQDLIENWYGELSTGQFLNATQDSSSYVPAGWMPNAGTGTPPPGADQLFLEVIVPNCVVCHTRRGTDRTTNRGVDPSVLDNGKDIDFSTWAKFISHSAQIEQYIYERGTMPLSLRGYNAFWGSDAPTLLSSFLPNFSHGNVDGSIDQPGKPVADAGPSRMVKTSPVSLSGVNSRFVNSYVWSVISKPVGATATLTNTTSVRPSLAFDLDGDYVVRVIASNGTLSDNDSVTIRVDSTMTVDPKDLVFDAMADGVCMQPEEVCSIFTDTDPADGRMCVTCHASPGIGVNPPVFWSTTQPDAGTFYREVLSRVDFDDPENSLFLRKPSGNHHYGGLRSGFEVGNAINQQNYERVLNWIVEGAREQ